MAEAYMRTSGTAIREMPIAERTPPQTGPVTGKAVAKDEAHIAVATAANSFFVLPSTALGCDVQIGDRLSLRFYEGRASIDNGRIEEDEPTGLTGVATFISVQFRGRRGPTAGNRPSLLASCLAVRFRERCLDKSSDCFGYSSMAGVEESSRSRFTKAFH